MLAGALGQNGELCVGTGAAVGEFVQEAATGLRGDRNAFGEGVVRKEARGTLALWPAGREGDSSGSRADYLPGLISWLKAFSTENGQAW